MDDIVSTQQHVTEALRVGAGKRALLQSKQLTQGGLDDDFVALLNDLGRHEHPVSDEFGHKAGCRAVVQGVSLIPLMQMAGVHHTDAIPDGKCLCLVMGHKQGRGARSLENAAQFVCKAFTQVNIQVRKWLIQKQQGGVRGQGTGEGNALLLTTREFVWVAVLHPGQADQLKHGCNTGLLGIPGLSVQAKGNIAPDAEVRKQRVVLKYHADAPPFRGHLYARAADRLALNVDPATAHRLQASDCAQQRCLATSGWADEDANLASLQRHGHLVYRCLGLTRVLKRELLNIEEHDVSILNEYNSHLSIQANLQMSRRLNPALLVIIAIALALPLLSLAASWLDSNPEHRDILRQMADTVLPEYLGTTVVLCLAVGLGVAVVGMGTAAAVTLFDFPGRRIFEWMLLLPLAMPAYVVAYAYTDFLQFSGPFQTFLRETFGWQGRVFPEIRNTAGAAWVFVFTLYPYVYLLARTALSERAGQLMEAARMLGAPLGRRIRQIALPLARPAVAAGMALALMETLADFGVSSYFGIQTFVAGIYKAWLSMDNRIAAAQLATLLLVVIAVLMALESRSQRRLRFAASRGQREGGQEARRILLTGRHGGLAVALCLAPVAFGFVFPAMFMLRPLVHGWDELPWGSFLGWAGNSARLAGLSALLATLLALILAYGVRSSGQWLGRAAVRLVSLGYAIPGAVIVVGILLPVGWIQQIHPETSLSYWITATVLGVIWAYLVRFTAVALQSVQSGYTRVPRSLDESARMLGSTGAMLAWRVHWPLLRRSVTAAALLVFVDVMKELPATLVLRPFNSDTLAVVAYQLARDERLGEAALPALALVLVGLIPVMMLSRTLRRT